MGKENGIDFGTTNTVISYTNIKGKLRQLRYDSKKIIPSVIYFCSQGEYLIGKKAKKRLAENPESGMANLKLEIAINDRIEITP